MPEPKNSSLIKEKNAAALKEAAPKSGELLNQIAQEAIDRYYDSSVPKERHLAKLPIPPDVEARLNSLEEKTALGLQNILISFEQHIATLRELNASEQAIVAAQVSAEKVRQQISNTGKASQQMAEYGANIALETFYDNKTGMRIGSSLIERLRELQHNFFNGDTSVNPQRIALALIDKANFHGIINLLNNEGLDSMLRDRLSPAYIAAYQFTNEKPGGLYPMWSLEEIEVNLTSDNSAINQYYPNGSVQRQILEKFKKLGITIEPIRLQQGGDEFAFLINASGSTNDDLPMDEVAKSTRELIHGVDSRLVISKNEVTQKRQNKEGFYTEKDEKEFKFRTTVAEKIYNELNKITFSQDEIREMKDKSGHQDADILAALTMMGQFPFQASIPLNRRGENLRGFMMHQMNQIGQNAINRGAPSPTDSSKGTSQAMFLETDIYLHITSAIGDLLTDGSLPTLSDAILAHCTDENSLGNKSPTSFGLSKGGSTVEEYFKLRVAEAKYLLEQNKKAGELVQDDKKETKQFLKEIIAADIAEDFVKQATNDVNEKGKKEDKFNRFLDLYKLDERNFQLMTSQQRQQKLEAMLVCGLTLDSNRSLIDMTDPEVKFRFMMEIFGHYKDRATKEPNNSHLDFVRHAIEATQNKQIPEPVERRTSER